MIVVHPTPFHISFRQAVETGALFWPSHADFCESLDGVDEKRTVNSTSKMNAIIRQHRDIRDILKDFLIFFSVNKKNCWKKSRGSGRPHRPSDQSCRLSDVVPFGWSFRFDSKSDGLVVMLGGFFFRVQLLL